MALNLGDYESSDDEGNTVAPPVAPHVELGEASHTSFFSADGVDVTDSEPEEAASDDEAPAAPAAIALPPVRQLLAVAPPRPEFLHRAAIYDVREISAFDRRVVPEKPKPWLKAAPGPPRARGPAAEAEPANTNEVGAGEKAGDEEAKEPPAKGSRRDILAQQVMAAAMAMRTTYKLAPDAGVGGEKELQLAPQCELNALKRGGKAPTNKTFQQREKRKRDLGQQAREGSYVEEEKRILRQSMLPGFGQGFD